MLSLFQGAIRIYPMFSFRKFSEVGPLLQVHGTCESCEHHENRKNTSRYPQIINASQLVAFVSVKENIQRANNVIIGFCFSRREYSKGKYCDYCLSRKIEAEHTILTAVILEKNY